MDFVGVTIEVEFSIIELKVPENINVGWTINITPVITKRIKIIFRGVSLSLEKDITIIDYISEKGECKTHLKIHALKSTVYTGEVCPKTTKSGTGISLSPK